MSRSGEGAERNHQLAEPLDTSDPDFPLARFSLNLGPTVSLLRWGLFVHCCLVDRWRIGGLAVRRHGHKRIDQPPHLLVKRLVRELEALPQALAQAKQ